MVVIMVYSPIHFVTTKLLSRMKIQLNTDKNINGTDGLEAFVNEKITDKLKHFADHISRVEVHLSDQNGPKTNIDDIHCSIEARIEGGQPISVTGKSDTKEKALSDAISKIKAALDTRIGKLKDK